MKRTIYLILSILIIFSVFCGCSKPQEEKSAVISEPVRSEDDILYDKALSLIDEGKYEQALAVLESIDSYTRIQNLIDLCNLKLHENEVNEEDRALIEHIKTLKPGDTFEFGIWEQNNVPGEEPIEWIVLEMNADKALVISKYVLEAQPYNETQSDEVFWENSTLRDNLNSSFLFAFEVESRDLILPVTVKAEVNPKYETPAGNDTEDKIFILSLSEIEKYFSNEEDWDYGNGKYVEYPDRQVEGTVYANVLGLAVDDRGYCSYWVRTPGDNTNGPLIIDEHGEVTPGYWSEDPAKTDVGVRPAMWISLK